MFRTIFAILIIIAAVLGIVLVAVPQYQSTQDLRNDIAELEEALQKAAELRQARETLLAKRNAFQPQDLQKLEELLPSSVDNVKLVSIDLDRLSQKHGLVLRDVSVQEAQDVVSDPSQATNPLGTVRINFSTQGSYGDFLSFISDIEHSLRIIDVEAINFVRQEQFDRNGQEVISDFYEFQVTIATYWLRRGTVGAQAMAR